MVGGGAIEIELGSGLECGSQARSTGDADGSNRGASRWTAAMIGLPASARVWLATGYTDMRKDFSVAGLAGSRDSALRPAERSSVLLSRPSPKNFFVEHSPAFCSNPPRFADGRAGRRWHRVDPPRKQSCG